MVYGVSTKGEPRDRDAKVRELAGGVDIKADGRSCADTPVIRHGQSCAREKNHRSWDVNEIQIQNGTKKLPKKNIETDLLAS
jgi:hypothetical protein